MIRGKVIKKRTKNRETLLRNLRKGIARKEPRCPYQIIPYPVKFASASPIYHLYGDLILMEYQDTLITEHSLYNNIKIYKHAQTLNCAGQKCIKILSEKKNDSKHDWRTLVETLRNSESSSIREWCGPITKYCERYEKVIQELKTYNESLPKEKYQALLEMNKKTEKTKQTLFKSFPCIELKYQFKENQIQLTELIFSEKYLEELGYDIESFSSIVFQEGIPKTLPFGTPGTSSLAKLCLEKHLAIEQNGFQTPECDMSFLMKNGYTRKIKLKVHYITSYEKGSPGFSIIGAIVARQKASLKTLKEVTIDRGFIQLMTNREKEVENFLLSYYETKAEQTYTNFDKICRIKEI